MSDPVVFISRHRIKEGKLEELKEFTHKGVGSIEADKPDTAVFLLYLDEDEDELTAIHVFADAAALDAHLQGADERARQAYELMEPMRFDVYGEASDTFVQMMKQPQDAGIPVNHNPRFLDGFTRFPTPGSP